MWPDAFILFMYFFIINPPVLILFEKYSIKKYKVVSVWKEKTSRHFYIQKTLFLSN